MYEDVAVFFSIRGLFILFLIALYSAAFCVLASICEAQSRLCDIIPINHYFNFRSIVDGIRHALTYFIETKTERVIFQHNLLSDSNVFDNVLSHFSLIDTGFMDSGHAKNSLSK